MRFSTNNICIQPDEIVISRALNPCFALGKVIPGQYNKNSIS